MRFASHVAKAHPTAMLTAMLDAAHAAERDLGSGGSVTDRCPACGSVIEDDGGEIGRCAKGHEWSKSSLTHPGAAMRVDQPLHQGQSQLGIENRLADFQTGVP